MPFPHVNIIGNRTNTSAMRDVLSPLRRVPLCYERMKFICQVQETGGTWTAEHAGPDIGPVRVTAPSRDEALRKLEAEIRYWLEMCPCSGQTYQNIDIELLPQRPPSTQ